MLMGYGIWFLIGSVLSYLIGSVSFSIIAAKLSGDRTDIRSKGSGNAGFTNVLRTVGLAPAMATFAGDFLKGVAAVWLGRTILTLATGTSDVILLSSMSYLCGLCCVVGHLYPCFFGLRGGKGILTAWSIMLLIDWRVFLVVISIFLVVLIVTKIVSLASLSAAVAYSPTIFLFTYFTNYKIYYNLTYLIFVSIVSVVISAMAIVKHRSNIERLLAGSEKKITRKR